MAVPLDFGFQSNTGRFGHDGTANLINCYPEIRGDEGKSKVIIYAVHGLKSFATDNSVSDGTRGFQVLGDNLYWVVDRTLNKVDPTGALTVIGGLADDGPVQMARNQKANTPQIAIVTQNGLRFILEDDVLTPISDTDLPPPNSVAFLDGYMVYGIPDGRLFYSEVNDAANIGALNFVTAESKADGIKTIITVARELFVLGDETIESFQASGDTNNPIVPLRGAPIQYGCLEGGTAAFFDNSLIWVANDRTVRRLTGGYTPTVIGTPEVHELLREEATITNLRADVYRMQGHEFYVLSGTNFTRVFDASTGRWHTRKSKTMDRWRGQGIVQFGQKWLAGDKDNGTLYEIDAETYDENGNDLVMSIISKQQHDFPNDLIFDSLYTDWIVGVGLNSTDAHDQDPQVTMRFSDDAGNSWSNVMSASLGKIGEYSTQVEFHALGSTGRIGRTFELNASANVAKGFMGASAELERVAA